LRDLYETHAATLLSYLMRLTRGDRHRAEDLLQETLVRAWRHPEARKGGEWSKPWLFIVARRIAIDHIRATQARPAEIGDDRLDDRAAPTDMWFDRFADSAQLVAALQALQPRYREVIVEIYLRDRSVAQTAERLGIPEGTVKSRTFYALQALRVHLTAQGPH
jgi:RNA polymerase sigma-70 factor (ECF subfamily)